MPYDGPYTSKPCGDSKPHDRHVYYTNGWYQCLGIPVEVGWCPLRLAGPLPIPSHSRAVSYPAGAGSPMRRQ